MSDSVEVGYAAPAAEQMGRELPAAQSSKSAYPANIGPTQINKKLAIQIGKSRSTKEIILLRGYPCEEHTVHVSDDSSTLHLLRIPNGRFGTTRYAEKECKFPGVLLWHGLGLTSSSWVCNPSPDVHSNFAFVLADARFDVWLANGRGSNPKDHVGQKHTKKTPWNFSLDEMGYLDVPATVDYILNLTGRSSISYVGFSQGTAAGFAALSVSEELNKKINVFIALAPALQPSLPENKLAQFLIKKIGPAGLYSVLGKKQFLGFAQSLIQYTPPHLHSFAIRKAFEMLFGWDCSTMGCNDRQAGLLCHAFWGVPVKSIVHWFQIIEQNNCLLHYQDHGHHNRTTFKHTSSKNSSPVKFPIKHITTNVHVFAGAADNLCDISSGKRHLPPHAKVTHIKNYNHLDLIWAVDAKEKVWDHVLPILQNPHAHTVTTLKKTVSFARGTTTLASRDGSRESIAGWMLGTLELGLRRFAKDDERIGNESEDENDEDDEDEDEEEGEVEDEEDEEESENVQEIAHEPGKKFFVGPESSDESSDVDFIAESPPEIFHQLDQVLPTAAVLADLISQLPDNINLPEPMRQEDRTQEWVLSLKSSEFNNKERADMLSPASSSSTLQ